MYEVRNLEQENVSSVSYIHNMSHNQLTVMVLYGP